MARVQPSHAARQPTGTAGTRAPQVKPASALDQTVSLNWLLGRDRVNHPPASARGRLGGR